MKRFMRLAWLPALLVSLACSLFSPIRPGATVFPSAVTTTASTAVPLPALEGVITYSSDRDNIPQIIAVNADGSSETSLTLGSGEFRRPAWSPDGRRIAMRMDSGGGGVAVMDVRRENGKLLGSAPVEIIKDFVDAPRWSPDGTKLLYVGGGPAGGWMVYIWDLATASRLSIAGMPENSKDADWSPTGNQIVFAHYTDPSEQFNDIYVINADGSGLTQLTNTPELSEQGPVWSPDGQRIAFAGFGKPEGGKTNQDIFTMNRDGTNVFRVTTDPESDFDPSWSPDGRQIVFVTDRHENNDSNYEIYVINADGTGEQRLTNNHFTDHWPSWRAKQPEDVASADCQPGITLVSDVTIPNGTRFAAPQPFSKIWRVRNIGSCAWTLGNYVLRLVEGEPMGDLTEIPMPGAIQPGATVDLILPQVAPAAPGYHSSRWQLFQRNGQGVPGSDGNGVDLFVEIEVLPPGQTALPQPLYFLSEQSGSAQVWRMEPDARTVSQITNEYQPVITFDIALTGKIAYISQGQVMIADANGQNRQIVANLGADAPVRNLAWSADGNRLAYASQGIHLYDTSTGADRLLIADKDTQDVNLAHYAPLEWSPDGSKLTATKYVWESAGINILSASDGAVLFDQVEQLVLWNRDSQSIYLWSSQYSGYYGTEPGLWRGLPNGAPAQPLIRGASIWWPVQRSDGTLAYFMHQPTTQETTEFAPLLYASAIDGTNPVALGSWPISVTMNDTFDGIWADDGQSILVRLVRPALDVSEVLLIPASDSPPLFLASKMDEFEWGR